jgi:hypothetical protein
MYTKTFFFLYLFFSISVSEAQIYWIYNGYAKISPLPDSLEQQGWGGGFYGNDVRDDIFRFFFIQKEKYIVSSYLSFNQSAFLKDKHNVNSTQDTLFFKLRNNDSIIVCQDSILGTANISGDSILKIVINPYYAIYYKKIIPTLPQYTLQDILDMIESKNCFWVGMYKKNRFDKEIEEYQRIKSKKYKKLKMYRIQAEYLHTTFKKYNKKNNIIKAKDIHKMFVRNYNYYIFNYGGNYFIAINKIEKDKIFNKTRALFRPFGSPETEQILEVLTIDKTNKLILLKVHNVSLENHFPESEIYIYGFD